MGFPGFHCTQNSFADLGLAFLASWQGTDNSHVLCETVLMLVVCEDHVPLRVALSVTTSSGGISLRALPLCMIAIKLAQALVRS